MAKSPEEMAQSMIENMPEKTGKSLPEWIGVCRAAGLEKHGEIVKLLKSEHGITHGYANLIAHKSKEGGQAPRVHICRRHERLGLGGIHHQGIPHQSTWA